MSLVILGAIETRRPGRLEGAVRTLKSLREVAPQARVVWFNQSPSDAEIARLVDRFGVEAIDAPRFDAEHGIHARRVEDRRFLEYGAWLQEHPQDWVIATDSCDVLWQRNPETLCALGPFVVAQEARVVAACPFNRRWTVTFWPTLVNQLLVRMIVCCGVIVAAGRVMQRYLDHFADALPPQDPDRYQRGWDTACLAEWLMREQVTALPWANEHIVHLGYAPPDEVTWEHGQVRVRGTAPALVHQYYGHPAILQQAVARWI